MDTSELVLLTSENGFDLTLKKIAGSNRDDQLRLGKLGLQISLLLH